MSNDTPLVRTVELPASAHGWVRRSDLDTESVDTWELPDGSFYPCRKGHKPKLVTYRAGPPPLP